MGSAGYFIDSDGVKHRWKAKKPTVVIGAYGAQTLLDYGIKAKQIKATFGEREPSGSNYGGNYFRGDIHGDHGNLEYDKNMWPAAPTAEERAIIAAIADMSPSCSHINYWCAEQNDTVLDEVGWPDLFIYDPYHNPSELMLNLTSKKNIPVIIISDKYGTNELLEQTVIDQSQTFERLARAIGLKHDDISADKQAMCKSIKKFQGRSKKAQRKGVRAMAAYLPYTNVEPGLISGFYCTPTQDPVLAMLEENGMAIIHHASENSYWEYGLDKNAMNATHLKSNTGGDYNVDFWLYDDRNTLDFQSNSFKEYWPHPAVKADQQAYWPANSRIFTYKHVTEILDIVGAQLRKAEQVIDAPFECVDGGPTKENDMNHRNDTTKKLGPGQYLCYKPIKYRICDECHDNPSHYTPKNIGTCFDLKSLPKNDREKQCKKRKVADVCPGVCAGNCLCNRKEKNT